MRSALTAAQRPPSLLLPLLVAGALASAACAPSADTADTEAAPADSSAAGDDLAARVEARLATLDATSSLWAKHIPTGRTIRSGPTGR